MRSTKPYSWLIILLLLAISICEAASQTNQWVLKSFDSTMINRYYYSGGDWFVSTDSTIIQGADGSYAYPQTDGSFPHFSNYLWDVFYNYPVVSDGTVMYSSGGSASETYNDVYYALLNSDGTPDKSSLSTNRFHLNTARDLHASTIYNGRYYVAGGSYIINRDGQAAPTNTVEYAVMQPDHSLGPFQYLNPLNMPIGTVYLSWVNGNRWYVMGSGTDCCDIVRNEFKVDGTLGDWTTLVSLTVGGPAAINNQNTIVMVDRAYDSTKHNKTYIIKFDPVKESFTVVNGPYTVVGRVNPAVTSWKQYIYILGGSDTVQRRLTSYEMMVPNFIPTKKVSSLEANPSYGGVQLSWENPNLGDYAGTLVVSRTDRYPVSPTDGNMVYWYNGTNCNVSVPNGQQTYFGVFSHDTSYSFSSGAFVSAIPDSYQNISKASLSEPWVGAEVLSWANPTVTNQYDATIVLRRTDRYPNDPADGYNATDGTWFRYWYNGNGMGELGLTDTSYFYLLYANDTFMNFSSGVGGRHIPGWTGIPNVSQIASYLGYGSISINWVNPTTGNYNGTHIIRNTNHYPTGPTDGIAVYHDNGTSYTDTGLTQGQKYYYGLYTYDNNTQYSPGMVVSDMPGSFRNVESLEDYSDSTSITLNWVNPDRGDYQNTLIIRRTDRMPLTPIDGDIVYWFHGTTFTDTNVTSYQTYYYTLFAHDRNMNCSPGTGIAVNIE